ncbi:MAG: acyltransferase [Lachnospiraceae bacterium]|nr:acyltransferase [Lachnospiraceae bacterium]
MKKTSDKSTNDSVNLQFKLLSAIGIIIIVSGHCYHGGISLAYEWFPTYSFNLSLFVFISGYFYKPDYENTILKYIWKRTKRLLIPAYIWNIIYGLLILILNRFGYTIGAGVTPYNLFIMPFIDGEAFCFNLGSWFVYPLFIVCLFNILFRKSLGILKIKNEYFFFIIYLLIGICGIQIAIDGRAYGLLKLFSRAMLFLPCFQLGRLYNEKLEKHDKLCNAAYFTIIFAVQLLLLTFFSDLEYIPSSMAKFNNGHLMPYITSITGIAFWLRISKIIAPTIKNWQIIRLISDNTYSIMIHQMLGYMCVKWGFYLLSIITPLFSDFDINTMKASIWYYYLPKGLQQYAILYLAGGIFVPIAIKKLCDYIYIRIK